MAHAELLRRKFAYDDGKWMSTDDCAFDVDAQKLVQRDEIG
jgi:hypothetical protein